MLFSVSISDFIKKDSRDVVLDLEGLSRFDSQSLASLIRIKRKLDSLDRTLRIINYNEAIFRVIELAGMEDFVL
ncbi:MAG TPA: STAS domain-containing protein [Spirochaetota bacterium]|nr:STAS domain-containing protein [Spirochaetota bacterium]